MPVRLPQEQKATIRGNSTAIYIRGHLVAANGWKIQGKKAIVAPGGYRLCCSGCRQSSRQRVPTPNKKGLRYIGQPNIIDDDE
ncbi:hypothetical protein [Aestuariivirga sp.]|jgi:hypothetical protein|uniref:hypothetical protein n=1 Tax=Aestuariivirga sp. TaxID=2650926 RepID=UPI0037839B6E